MQETLRKHLDDKAKREHIALKNALDSMEALPEDSEIAHGMAEKILCDYLIVIGAKQLADSFDEACETIGFWYA